MKSGLLALLLASLVIPVQASEWQFNQAIAVTAADKPGVFYHIDSSGRKNIAVNTTTVAVVWEDNRSGAAQIYIAFKTKLAPKFTTALLVSTRGNAYEPSIVSVTNDHFVVAWEQDGTIWARSVTATTLGNAVQLDKSPSAQVTLAASPTGGIYAAWAQKHTEFSRIVTSRLTLEDDQLRAAPLVAIDASPLKQDQLYPSMALSQAGLVIAWEDRRYQHTRLFYSFSSDGNKFTPFQQLNEFLPPQNPRFGRGTGVTRVALAATAQQRVAATWMDKRSFLGGYDIYASVSEDGGKTFGKNELVEDSGMENFPQWHPAIAIDPAGLITVVWDDNRYDSADIWLSSREQNNWSNDVSPAPASDEGEQTNPSIAFDQQGLLHLIWINKQAGQDPQLLYSVGTRSTKH